MKKVFATLLTLLTALQLGFAALPVHAQLNNALSGPNGLNAFGSSAGYQNTGSNSLITTIAGVVKALLGFMGIIFVLLVIYAGFLWMTAGGDSKKVDQAKAIIKNCVIGLVIMVLAYSITSFVFNQLQAATQNS